LSDALLDRMDLSLTVPALDMKQEFELLYETASFSADLVDSTRKVMTLREMEEVWDQVDAIQIPPAQMFFLTLLRAMLTQCRHYDRSTVEANHVQQKCQQCTYKGEVCSQLKRVPAFRISKSAAKISKALAYLGGNPEVGQEDILRSFALALPHRVQLHPAVRNQYGSEHEWVKQVFFQSVDTKQNIWKEAAKKFTEALKGKKKAREELKELGNKDIAVYGAYQAWFGKTGRGVFTEVAWQS